MPYCLNPDCPYRERVGKPAEFIDGIELCSDCGSPLSEDPPPISEEPAKEAFKFVFSDWHKRILFTLGILLIYRILVLIPAPGIDHNALERLFGTWGEKMFGLFGFSYVTILALGILPYISAYMLVEIFALFAPPLKKWRESDYRGRIKLRRVGLVATFFLALLQGYNIAVGIEGMADGMMVPNSGMGFRLLVSLTLTTGTFLLIWMADLITTKGIGHGISVLIFAGFAPALWTRLPDILQMYHDDRQAASLMVAAALALMVLVAVAERTYKKVQVRYDDGSEAYIPLKLTTAGITPIFWASSLIFLPAVLLSSIDNLTLQRISDALVPGEAAYTITYVLIVVFLYFFFTSVFYNSGKMIAVLKAKGASVIVPPGKSSEDYIDRNLVVIAFIGVSYLCVLRFLPDISSKWWNVPVVLGGVGFIKAVAIALDLIEDVRARRNGGNLVKVAEVHDVPTAGLAKSLLEGKGVPCHLRGYYHRALLYFFGPYIEISVLVSEGQASEAREAIEKYVGPEILVQQAGAD
jgi:preprotein translocase subunit SecY